VPDVPQVENLRYGMQPHFKPTGREAADECGASSTGFQPVPDVPQVENLRYGRRPREVVPRDTGGGGFTPEYR
jgi:hypothetical protein